jgi:hypothetical protein
MTFAEIIFFCLFVLGVYRLLRPLERRLERWIHRRLTSRKRGAGNYGGKPDIEINDYKKNN